MEAKPRQSTIKFKNSLPNKDNDGRTRWQWQGNAIELTMMEKLSHALADNFFSFLLNTIWVRWMRIEWHVNYLWSRTSNNTINFLGLPTYTFALTFPFCSLANKYCIISYLLAFFWAFSFFIYFQLIPKSFPFSFGTFF